MIADTKKDLCPEHRCQGDKTGSFRSFYTCGFLELSAVAFSPLVPDVLVCPPQILECSKPASSWHFCLPSETTCQHQEISFAG